MSDNTPQDIERLASTVKIVLTRADYSLVLQVQRASLRVMKGPDKRKSVQIPPEGLIVGTAPTCGLVLSDEAVSRTHLDISFDETGVRIRDLGSKNGTQVDGVRVVEALLSGGEHIQIGKSELRLSLLPERDEFELSPKTSFGPLIGHSVAMRRAFALLESAAPSEATVLLEGDTGTGKELAARAIHEASPRRDEPFVVVDCGSLAPGVLESELFGHCKGAFTGATRDRAGAFLEAQHGTVFLDEIGELVLEMQPRLLRVLENREIRPVDVRVVAATNRDLKSEAAAGKFREDLFYRLSVVRIRLPPLKERREDIGPLARSFVEKLRPGVDPLQVIGDDELAMLTHHDWPGNVRELRNVVERLLVLPGKTATAIEGNVTSADSAAPDSMAQLMQLPFHEARHAWNERFERSYLATVLAGCEGVVAHAAEKSGIPRQTFHRLLAKYRLAR
jgi:DNA-binding NtrC family response regulator